MSGSLVLRRALAIVGTILVWLTLAAPLVFGLLSLFAGSGFRLDWLMPAELFPVALTGGVLLTSAALLHRAWRALIIGSLCAACAMLVLGQMYAVASGLASGAIEATGLPFVLVTSSIALFSAALAVLGIGGILLWRALFLQPHQADGNPGAGVGSPLAP